ncbi:sugar ABC transporter permease [Candidatus Aerophobetes bacterium Ae_b3a]|nr:MAG: sugar ABC transporter permease [Candidatus Aerophobetes bacterium Ae_b3a]
MSRIRNRERRIGIFLILPCLLFVLAFVMYPLFRNIFLSFHAYNPLHSLETIFVGLDNYRWLTTEPLFLNSLYVTVLFTVVSVIFEMFIGFFVALFLVRMKDILSKWVSRFLTSIFIIPWVVPGISAAVAWRMLYHPTFGPINTILGKNIMWLSNSSLSLFSIVIADVWKCTPFFIFIFFAGMMSVPIEQFEAARTDGASMWQEFRYIMLPSILPLMLVASAFRAIDAFTKIFDLVYVLTGGGPGAATEVLPLLIYKTGLKYFRFGTASTLAVVAILISLVFGMGLLRRQR